jgi:hypothetical protein
LMKNWWSRSGPPTRFPRLEEVQQAGICASAQSAKPERKLGRDAALLSGRRSDQMT